MESLTKLMTVEQAAKHLNLHPKTILRYIHDGRLPATRVGKSYRIARTKLNIFAGITNDQSESIAVRATCIVEISHISVDAAERLATFLQSAAMANPSDKPSLHLQTVFDPLANSMKVIVIANPSNVAKVLEMLQMYLM